MEAMILVMLSHYVEEVNSCTTHNTINEALTVARTIQPLRQISRKVKKAAEEVYAYQIMRKRRETGQSVYETCEKMEWKRAQKRQVTRIVIVLMMIKREAQEKTRRRQQVENERAQESTRPCQYFRQGRCRFGNECWNSHAK